MREYLMDADFERAEKNGIPAELVKQRFYGRHWSKSRSITQPYKPITNIWGKFKDASLVCQNTFHQRIRNGMTPEDAAFTPSAQQGGKLKPLKVTKEDIAEAERNGISENTLRYRVSRYKWSVDRAKTEPVKTQFRRKDYEAPSS